MTNPIEPWWIAPTILSFTAIIVGLFWPVGVWNSYSYIMLRFTKLITALIFSNLVWILAGVLK